MGHVLIVLYDGMIVESISMHATRIWHSSNSNNVQCSEQKCIKTTPSKIGVPCVMSGHLNSIVSRFPFIPPKTNMAPPKRCHFKGKMLSSNHDFWGDILVLGWCFTPYKFADQKKSTAPPSSRKHHLSPGVFQVGLPDKSYNIQKIYIYTRINHRLNSCYL